jgi:soluble lytic murein transglycosylase-like protein
MEKSIAKQKASITKQAGDSAPANSFFTSGWSGPALIEHPPAPPTAQLNCDAIQAEAEPLIVAAASMQKVDAALVRAVIRQESGFRPCAVSTSGAMGMMQLMPQTAAQYNVADPFDPELNINGGVQYLKDLLARYKGDVKLALAAYNAGPGRVDGNAGGVPAIPETQDYVRRIMSEFDKTQAKPAANL